MTPIITHLHISPGGVPKLPQPTVQITRAGIQGDGQRDLEHHGGPNRAVCLYALELIEALNAEGHPIFPGAAGENVTIQGLDWPALRFGQRLRLGPTAVIELTCFANPCYNLIPYFLNGDFKRISAKVYPGWSRFCGRVLCEGLVSVGDAVTLLDDSTS